MKRLTKEKRNQLIIIALGTVGVLVLIGFGLISPQLKTLAQTRNNIAAAQNKLEGMKDTLKKVDTKAVELATAMAALTDAEGDTASGDPYSWANDTIRRLKPLYKVEIPEIGHPAIEAVDLLPGFPYKQLRFNISGTAFYHDLGKFVADFENRSPHSRIVNLALYPAGGVGADAEKLTFSMDIVVLTKASQ